MFLSRPSLALLLCVLLFPTFQARADESATPAPVVTVVPAEDFTYSIWLNRSIMGEGDEAIVAFLDMAKARGVTHVMPNFWFHGCVIYPGSKLVPQHPDFIGRDPMEVVVREAHARGMKVWPWAEYGFFVHFNRTLDEEDNGPILKAHPEWRTMNRAGVRGLANDKMGVMHFSVDPTHPEARTFIRDICMEVGRRYPVDGINLDRIRFMGRDWGYDMANLKRYTKATGNPTPFEADVPEFDAWRRERITLWAETFAKEWRKEFPERPITAAVNPPYLYQDKFQHFDEWVRAGSLDIAMPMIYGGAELVGKESVATEAMLPEGAQWFAGVDASAGDDALAEFVKVAHRAGANGVAIWDDVAFRKGSLDLRTVLAP